MRILLKSMVKGNFKDVFKAFDQDLFEYLLPPGAKILRFDGSKKNDLVHLKFEYPKAEWLSEIVEAGESDTTCYFIDEGRKLPFGIRSWSHKHLVHKIDEGRSIIEDDMMFSTGNRVLDLLYFPALYLAFLPRVYHYKMYFKKLDL